MYDYYQFQSEFIPVDLNAISDLPDLTENAEIPLLLSFKKEVSDDSTDCFKVCSQLDSKHIVKGKPQKDTQPLAETSDIFNETKVACQPQQILPINDYENLVKVEEHFDKSGNHDDFYYSE